MKAVEKCRNRAKAGLLAQKFSTVKMTKAPRGQTCFYLAAQYNGRMGIYVSAAELETGIARLKTEYEAEIAKLRDELKRKVRVKL
jgi:hypothetical protein